MRTEQLKAKRTLTDINGLFVCGEEVFSLILDGRTADGTLYQVGVSEAFDGDVSYAKQESMRPLVFSLNSNGEGPVVYVGRRIPELPKGKENEEDRLRERAIVELQGQRAELQRIVQRYAPGTTLEYNPHSLTHLGRSGPVLVGILPDPKVINGLVQKVTVAGRIAQELGLDLNLIHYEVC